MMKAISLITLTLLVVLTTACQNRSQDSAEPSPAVTSTAPVSPAPSPAKVNNVTEQWLGQWNGPEGTFLLLIKTGDGFELKIQSLDGPQTFTGVAVGDHIEFQRDGKTESVRAASGKETGMKWLLEKQDCLIIKEGEGFCRK